MMDTQSSGKIGGTLHTTLVYEELIFAYSYIRLGLAKQEIDANGACVAGLATVTPV